MNLALIGYRGAGKSLVAQHVAARLGWRAVSTDARVIERAGRAIPDIVARDGWEYFRDLETEVCAALAREDHLVIDTGGGVIVRPNNVAALKTNSLVFWLTATVDTIAQRIATDTQRPSLTPGKTFVEEIRDVLTEREPRYRAAADYIIATDDRAPDDIAADIVQAATQAHEESQD